MKLAILTDRYYPDVVGGGEISLAYLVQGLGNRSGMDIRILVQSSRAADITVETCGRVTLVRIPVHHDISLEKMRVAPLTRNRIEKRVQNIRRKKTALLRWVGKISLAVTIWGHYFLKKTNTPTSVKLSLFVSNLISSLGSRTDMEYLDADFPFFDDPAPLYDTIRSTPCDVIHADNTRSILRYAESGADVPCVAVFRDLKFVCPRRKIIAHWSGGVCRDCRFQCLADFPAIQRPFIKKVFQANINYRQSALKKFTRVVCTSHFLKNGLQNAMGLTADVIPNPAGVPLSAIHAARSETCRPLPKKILFVGMLNPNKGPDTAVEMLHTLVRQGINARLYIAGRGLMASELKEKARILKIDTQVVFLGFLEKEALANQYRSAHVVVCPTRWPEPFGRVPIEAMAFGVPTVAYRLGGFSETILDGETGYLAAPGDRHDLCLKVKKILTDETLRKEMSEKCRAHVAKRFSVEAIAEQYAALYKATIRSAVSR